MNAQPDHKKLLHDTALKAPKSSGVYLWRNEDNIIIYVGKAKNLKNRLSSYFSQQRDIKTRMLISRARSIEYITTATEYDALILENTLIKQHSPRYNINLKDDKSYPVLRITNEDFPRIFKTRRIIQDGSQYFGPYPNVAALDAFIDAIHRIYKLRRCKRLRKRASPCMYYHIGRCDAPCCDKITKESYNEFIGEILQLLESQTEKSSTSIVEKLTSEMQAAAKALYFEKAARLRDGIAAISLLGGTSVTEDFDSEGRDYIGFASDGPLVTFIVLKMRFGKLIGRDVYRTKTLNSDDELISEFLPAYYTETEHIPAQIFVPQSANLELIQQWFSITHGLENVIREVADNAEIAKTMRKHTAALAMATQNAKEDIIRRIRERGDMPAMEELQKLLSLPFLPVRIEGFDIAHIGGKLPVASLISFYNGNPDKKNYRYFRLKTTDGIIDDFASMREASMRRYSRLLREQAEMPDLILIDGGIGQVNAVQGVLDELGLDIPIVGLAKQDEELYLPGNSTPISLPKRSDALRLLQRIRDETHRFATTRNQRLRSKQNTTLVFEQLPNVGPRRARKLLDAFETLDGLIAADTSAIYTAIGGSPEQAQSILDGAILLRENSQKPKQTKTTTSSTKKNPNAENAISDIARQALGE